MGDTFRALQVAPLTEQDVQDMARELAGGAPTMNADGYSYADFWYGNFAFYRAMAFGFPSTRALVLSRCRPTHPPRGSGAPVN